MSIVERLYNPCLNETMATIEERLSETTQPDPERRYYAITLTATEKGDLLWGTQSRFSRFTESTPRREIRVPRVVIPEQLIDFWKRWGQPYVVVRSCRDLGLFLIVGGNALVDVDLVAEHFDFLRKGVEVAPDGICSSIEAFRIRAMHNGPQQTPKRRMEVLNRDRHRCVICGRQEGVNVDFELNVHHIRPRAEGGLTKPNNLITICRRCHKGLNPHYDRDLFEKLPGRQTEARATEKEMTVDLEDGIRCYRKLIWQLIMSHLEEGAK